MLFSAPIGGGGSVDLDVPVTQHTILDLVSISPDSSRVVFLIKQYWPGDPYTEVYSAPILGGSSPIRLNGPLVNDRSVVPESVRIRPDSLEVVYASDELVDDRFDLFTVPITGGAAPQQINPTLADPSGFLDVDYTPDGQWILYLARQDDPAAWELYRVRSNGASPGRVNAPLPSGGNVLAFEPTPDSNRVVHRSDLEAVERFELFEAPTLGGTSTRLSAPLPPGGDVVGFALAGAQPDVVYLADGIVDQVFEVFVVDVDPDADGDGAPNLCDCDDAAPATHPGAVEVNDGLDNQCPGDPGSGIADETSGDSGFHTTGDKTRYSWPAQSGATAYEVARATAPDFFADCTTWTSTSTETIDAAVPAGDAVFFYLNRPIAPHVGSFGQDSSGSERVVPCSAF
jgi:hypothetical protein